jgi:hypothetical protein
MALFVNKTAILNDADHSNNHFSHSVNNGKKIAHFNNILDSFANNANLARSANTKQFDVTVGDTYIAKSELYYRLINGIVNHDKNADSENILNKTTHILNNNSQATAGSNPNSQNEVDVNLETNSSNSNLQ